ncbi:DNA-binding protein WhiA [Gudongella sp. DL1XJH-153]|uniref:DNA-binding protein WhiA n=1 Tax=Gudongella sp. DL1XJH-153 TaxID=3409804 RepID=UPI003BB56797
MSFSSITKNELSRIEIENDCCALAELAALVRMNGTVQITGMQNINLRFTTENAAIARRIFSILKIMYHSEIEVMVRKNKQLKKNNNYLIIIHDKNISEKVLSDVGYIDEDRSNLFNPRYNVPKKLVSSRCCKRSFIRGSFLGGGSMSNPEKTYHLEFVTNHEEHAKSLRDIINSFELNSKIIQRKDNFVVYIKEGEQIVDLLNIIGAHQALLKLEDIRVLKEVRNNINRLVNCETANLGKTIGASIRQIESIKAIQRRMGINKLPDNLREIAEVRMANPDASLKEIGEMMNPPIGKSGVNHRFRRLEEIAEELGGGN